MRSFALLALAALIGGVALLAYSAAVGQGQVHLVLIFPVFTGTGLLPFLGMLLIFAAFFLGFWAFATQPSAGLPQPVGPVPPPPSPPPAPARRFGGVVFLGPFPIIFGSDAKMAKYMLVLGIALTVLLLAFFFLVLMG